MIRTSDRRGGFNWMFNLSSSIWQRNPNQKKTGRLLASHIIGPEFRERNLNQKKTGRLFLTRYSLCLKILTINNFLGHIFMFHIEYFECLKFISKCYHRDTIVNK